MNRLMLIADADDATVAPLRRVLSQMAYQIDTARDGIECLAKLRARTPAVLLLNLDLLWGGGAGVLEWLHEEQDGCTMPAVLLTGAESPEQVASLLAPPRVQYLEKPFSLATLFAALQRVQRSGSPRRRLELAHRA